MSTLDNAYEQRSHYQILTFVRNPGFVYKRSHYIENGANSIDGSYVKNRRLHF
ncbi:hypothetical protein H6G64_35745 [Calothrix sp. FACHB-156]|nr:hypothetical protein [Calothrix sp. FACHB-156]